MRTPLLAVLLAFACSRAEPDRRSPEPSPADTSPATDTGSDEPAMLLGITFQPTPDVASLGEIATLGEIDPSGAPFAPLAQLAPPVDDRDDDFLWDPASRTYTFTASSHLRTVDGYTGEVVFDVTQAKAGSLERHPVTGVIYGLKVMGDSEVSWFGTVEPSSGRFTEIAAIPELNSAHNGGAHAIDPVEGIYVFHGARADPVARWWTVLDLETGEVLLEQWADGTTLGSISHDPVSGRLLTQMLVEDEYQYGAIDPWTGELERIGRMAFDMIGTSALDAEARLMWIACESAGRETICAIDADTGSYRHVADVPYPPYGYVVRR